LVEHVTSPGNGAGAGGGTQMEITVVDVPERGRFEIRDGDRAVGLASYHVDDGLMTLPHTEIDPALGGRGLGTQLVGAVLAAARERQLHVLPYCSFIRKYLLDHPEELDLVAESDRPTFGLATANS
jgi:predicted GNAT family acetyltransferase